MSSDPDGSSWPLHRERMTHSMSSVGSAKEKNCLFADYSVLPSAPVSPWKRPGLNLDCLVADYSVLPSAPVSPWKRPGSNLDCLFADSSVLPSAPTISRRRSESNPYEDHFGFVSDEMLSGSTFQSPDDTAPKFPWRPQGSYTFKDDSERELIESLYVRPSKPPSFPSGLRLPESIPSDNISVVDQFLNSPAFRFGEKLDGPESMLNTARLLKNGEKRHKLICATEGFYLGEWKSEDYRSLCYGEPCEWPKECNHACAAAKFALSSYNRTEGKKLEFKELVRVNAQMFRNIIFLLTMKASDEHFYEAKVLWECDTNNMELYFVRVACHHPVRPGLQCLVGPQCG